MTDKWDVEIRLTTQELAWIVQGLSLLLAACPNLPELECNAIREQMAEALRLQRMLEECK